MPWTGGHTLCHTLLHKSLSDQDVSEWSHRLGCLNKEATIHTLQATTKIVKNVDAENRLTPRMHFKCHLPVLRPKHLKEGFSIDTFPSSTRSVRGFTCAQVFLRIESGHTVLIPLKSKANAFTAFIPPELHFSSCLMLQRKRI